MSSGNSKVVDERVVQMQFDNRNFEKNVSQSMSTLDKFKEKLKFTGASKGLEEVNNQASKVDLNPISRAVETVEAKFSAMSIAAYTAMYRMTNYAIDAGTRLVKSLSTDNIMAGWNKLQEKGKSMSTLLSQGFSTEEVEKQLDKLLWFTDETSYNFTDMINNISKFTATGKGLTDSVTAMQGIALWAAKSGQNAQTASGAMYQLSQALSAGFMRKEDWKSIQNANMDTKEFRQVAIDTAIQLKTLKKTGKDTYQSLKAKKPKKGEVTKWKLSEFTENLTDGQWFTSDVMMAVYKKYAKASDQMKTAIDQMSDDYNITLTAGQMIKAYDALKENKFDDFLKEEEIDDQAAIETLKKLVEGFDDFSISTFRAGQEYRSFADAIDATKDAVSTKWMKIFETLIGNIDAQKDLYSSIGEWFYEKFAAPLDEIQEVLNRWVDKGGRDTLWEGIRNITSAIGAFIKPIKQAFRDIFPKTTAQNLLDFTNKFKEFTEKLKISDETAQKLRNTFKGFFSILKTGLDIVGTVIKAAFKIIGSLKNIGKAFLTITGALGKFATKVSGAIKESGIFSKALNILVGVIEKSLTMIGDFITYMLSFKNAINIFTKIINVIQQVAKKIGQVIRELIDSGTAKEGAQVFNASVFGYILVNITKFLKGMKTFASDIKGSVESATKILDQLKGILQAYTRDIQAKTLIKIAEATLILVAALYILAKIDGEQLGKALSAMAIAMLELMGAFRLFTKIMDKDKGSAKNTFGIMGMAIALLITSKAIKELAELSWDQIGRGLTALAGAMFILIATTKFMGSTKSSWLGIYKEKKSLLGLAISLVIIAKGLQMLAELSWGDIARSLTAMALSFVILIAATKAMSNKNFKKAATGKSFVMITSILILAKGMKMLAELSWDDIARGLTALGGAMLILSLVVTYMGNTSKKTASKKERKNLIAMTASLITLAKGMQMLAVLSWSDIARSLVAMAGAFIILTMAIKSISKIKKKDNMALIAATASLIVMGKGLQILASLSWGDVAKSLITMAGAFIILAIAAKHLTGVANTLLKVGAAVVLLGVGTAIIGVGLLLIAGGITALAGALGASLTIIIGAITSIILAILDLVPEIVKAIGKLIVALCDVIIEAAPKIAKTIMVVLYEVIKSLADYLPMIVDELLKGLINVLRMIAARLPELIVAAVEVVQAFFKGFVRALKVLDKDTLVEGIKAVGMITVILLLMATLAALAPAAMIGILAFGVLVIELATVLSTIGKVLGEKTVATVTKAGVVLEAIGIAIGKFVGGLIAGVAHAVSSVMPTVASNLSKFMENLVPFIDLVTSKVNLKFLGNVGILSAAIVLLTSAGFVGSILSFLSGGGKGLSKLGTQLSEFMTGAKVFITEASRINPSAVAGVKSLAEAMLVITAAALLDRLASFGSWITGSSSITKFGKDLVKMGDYLNQFVEKIEGFGESEIKATQCAGKAITSLADAAKKIPRTGGLWAKLAGDNSIIGFGIQLPMVGACLRLFVENLGEFSEPQIATTECAAQAITKLAEAAQEIPNEGGLWAKIAGDNSIGAFSEKLPKLGKNMKDFAENLGTFDEQSLQTVRYSGEAIAAMAKAAKDIPNSGGVVSWFTGDNDLGTFGKYLPDLGSNISDFISNLTQNGAFDTSSANTIKLAGDCIVALAEAAGKIPKSTDISVLGGFLFSYSSSAPDLGKFSESLDTLGDNVKAMAEGFKDVDKADLEKVKIGAECIAALAQAAKELPSETEISVVWGLFKITSGGSTGDLEGFAKNFPKVAEGISGFVAELKNKGFKKDDVVMAESGANVIKKLAEAAKTIPTSGWYDKIIGTKDLQTFTQNFPKVAEGIGGFVSKLKEYDFKKDDVEIAEHGANVIKTLAEAAKLIPTSGWYDAILGTKDLKDFASKFESVGQGISKFINGLGTLDDEKKATVSQALEIIKTFASLEGKDLSKMIGNVKNLQSAMETMGTLVSSFVFSLSFVKQESLSSAIDKVKQLVDLCQNGIQVDNAKLDSFAKALSEIGKNAIIGFKDAMTDESAKKTASEGVRNLIDNLQVSMESMRSDLETKAASLTDTIISTFEAQAFIDRAYEAGKYFVEGFVNGITNNLKSVTEAGTKIGNYAYEAAKNAIDAHSPSRKAKKLGNFFGQGFVNGIGEYTKIAYDESYDMAEEASSGLSSAISKISDLIDGNIDSQPTIRPVLDLSDIQNKAGQINDIFDNANVGANLNAISKGMIGKNQNGNSDVVSAIDKLGKDIGNGGNTYNFNGISYSDNKEISDAIGVLLRAANVERRI